jgi:NitT/TauT family transport system permease protein
MFSGLAIGIGLAVPLGMLMGWFKNFEEIVDPLVQACRNSSVLALFPVFIMFFGIGEKAKIALITWGTVWVALLYAISGVKNVDPMLIKASRSMGMKDFAMLRKVLMPAALPSIATGVRLAAASATMIVIAAEMVGARAGLGYMVFYYQEKFMAAEMYCGLLIIALMGVAANFSLAKLERRLTAWQEKTIKD